MTQKQIEAEVETIPPLLPRKITEMKPINRQKELRRKTKTRKFIQMSRQKKIIQPKKTQKFAGIINRRNKQLEKIIINNVKVPKLLKKARDIVKHKGNAKSIETCSRL